MFNTHVYKSYLSLCVNRVEYRHMNKVQNLNQAVAYQEGSVVSREIIKKTTGTVTLFAFAAGQGLSEHISPFDALVLVFDGEAEIKLGGEIHNLSAGDSLLMPGGTPHSVQAHKPFKMMLTLIKEKSV